MVRTPQRRALTLGVAVFLLIAGVGLLPLATPTTVHAARFSITVSGNHLMDPSGAMVVLRGFSQGPTPFDEASAWARGQTPLSDGTLSAATLGAMRAWGANVVRVPVSAYICLADGTGCAASGPYLSTLHIVVATARADGLAVVLALFDDAQAGSPYTTTPDQLHPPDLPFLARLARAFGADGGVLYDVLNEPHYATDSQWLAAMQSAIATLRHAGATAPVVVQTPGNLATHPVCRTAAGVNVGQRASFTAADLAGLHDAQLVLSDHRYHAVVAGDATSETCLLGAARGVRPYLVGEWGVLPHSLIPYQCQGLSSANAAPIATAFLAWATANGVSTTAWNFRMGNAVTALAAPYPPTTFATGAWTCDNGSAAADAAGMGSVVKQWWAIHPSRA